MSNFIGYLLEIAGLPWALASSANAPVQFSQTILQRQFKVPESAPIRTDMINGNSESGGGRYFAINTDNSISANFLRQLSTDPVTRLTADLSASGLTLNTEEGTPFASLSYCFVGQETMSVLSTTANSITIAPGGRGKFGSEAVEHRQHSAVDGGQFPKVYGFPPSLSGRRCWLWRYDRNDPTSKNLMAAGQLEASPWRPDGTFEFTIKSIQQMVMDASALDAPFAKGDLHWDGHTVLFIDGLTVRLEDPDVTFPESGFWHRMNYVRIRGEGGAEELIGYQRVATRHLNTTTASGSVGNLLAVVDDGKAEVGDTIEIATSPVQRHQIKAVATNTWTLTGGLDPVPGNGIDVDVISKMKILPPLYRAGGDIGQGRDMERITLKDGQSVEEVRVFDGDQVRTFLWFLHSRRGGTVNGSYDILPEGWGTGILEDLIDAEAFEKLQRDGRTAKRTYVFSEPFQLWDMAKWIMRSCFAWIYTGRSGKLTVRRIRPRYPDDEAALALTVSNVLKDLISLDDGESRVRNFWQWSMERPLLDQGKDPKILHRVFEPDSRDLYKRRSLDPLADPGLVLANEEQLLSTSSMMWGRLARPQPLIRFKVPYDQAKDKEPGDYTKLTWLHMPDLDGGTGVENDFYELQSVVPRDNENSAECEAVRVPQGRYGLVAPAGKIQSIDAPNKKVTLFSQAATLYSQSGTEDSDHWMVGDVILFWDASTLSNASPVSATATINAINYALREITLDALPGWLAVNDYMVPSVWSNWSLRETSTQTPPQTLWQETFVAAADSSTTPPKLGSDNAFEYGG